jgi:hypothetical protein
MFLQGFLSVDQGFRVSGLCGVGGWVGAGVTGYMVIRVSGR